MLFGTRGILLLSMVLVFLIEPSHVTKPLQKRQSKSRLLDLELVNQALLQQRRNGLLEGFGGVLDVSVRVAR